METTREIKIGTKLNLNLGGKITNYEVRLIVGSEYKIFNKYTSSQWVTLEFINSNLVQENS